MGLALTFQYQTKPAAVENLKTITRSPGNCFGSELVRTLIHPKDQEKDGTTSRREHRMNPIDERQLTDILTDNRASFTTSYWHQRMVEKVSDL